jgi:hypothetical protein
MNFAIEGLTETLRAFQGLERDIRRQANGELRAAAGTCASGLVDELRAAAGGSGVPVAPRVARSVRIKSDRLPAVSIGGAIRVGRRGAPASRLLWGSEHGPRGAVNHFGVAPGPGYWIKPTVERFGKSRAVDAYKRAVVSIMRHYRLL